MVSISARISSVDFEQVGVMLHLVAQLGLQLFKISLLVAIEFPLRISAKSTTYPYRNLVGDG